MDAARRLVCLQTNIFMRKLDRNGSRLSDITYKDNMIVLGSEAGMVRIDPSEIARSEEFVFEK